MSYRCAPPRHPRSAKSPDGFARKKGKHLGRLDYWVKLKRRFTSRRLHPPPHAIENHHTHSSVGFVSAHRELACDDPHIRGLAHAFRCKKRQNANQIEGLQLPCLIWRIANASRVLSKLSPFHLLIHVMFIQSLIRPR